MICMTRWTVALLVPIAVALGAACGGDELPSIAVLERAEPQPDQSSEAPIMQVALASSDLSLGANRLAFGVIDRQSGALRDASVQVSTYRLTPSGPEGPKETVDAVWRKWPVGPGGVYTANLTFDTPGDWAVGLTITDAEGAVKGASTTVQVKEQSATPAIGAPVPRSESKTLSDVASLDEITTDPDPSRDLYAMSIAEAVDAPKPFVVVFATPAYCQTATCGPQLDALKELKFSHAGRANFIHIEVYDNPHEIQGDLDRARISPTLTEWNLPSEPWTFFVDEAGVLQAKFEGFATKEELEDALSSVLP